jgi:MerR family mercuric resistance operon transcriptional regulator
MKKSRYLGTGLSIGELAAQSDVPIDSIRYYERIGLFAAPPRTLGGQRRYGEEHIHRLKFIRRSRELGFSLDDVRSLVKLRPLGDNGCLETREIALRHLGQIRDKMLNLKRLERQLANMIARCSPGKQSTCPIIDSLDADRIGTSSP